MKKLFILCVAVIITIAIDAIIRHIVSKDDYSKIFTNTVEIPHIFLDDINYRSSYLSIDGKVGTQFLRNTAFPYCVGNLDKLSVYRSLVTRDDKIVGTGSAFYIGDGRWLSAAHVVDPTIGEFVSIVLPNKIISTEVEVRDVDNDYVILESEKVNIDPIELHTDNIKYNESVWNIGFPSWTLGNRFITSGDIIGTADNDKIIVTSATVLGGMSGGLTMICDGKSREPRAIGIINAFSKKIISQNDVERNGIIIRENTIINTGISFSFGIENIDEL